ncbi:hypothetical protein GJE05_07780 [Neisseria meningitidis]|nr:hypothetical protein GJE05_07780 [Neisseria meningitidis]
MLPHTGLFLLGKVALQMRIRRHLFCRHSDKRAGILLLNRQTEAYC